MRLRSGYTRWLSRHCLKRTQSSGLGEKREHFRLMHRRRMDKAGTSVHHPGRIAVFLRVSLRSKASYDSKLAESSLSTSPPSFPDSPGAAAAALASFTARVRAPFDAKRNTPAQWSAVDASSAAK